MMPLKVYVTAYCHGILKNFGTVPGAHKSHVIRELDTIWRASESLLSRLLTEQSQKLCLGRW